MRGAYERFDFQTIFHELNRLIVVDLSAFYVDVTKDRMYTLAAASHERRSTQTVMYLISDGLARLLAPILPVSAGDQLATAVVMLEFPNAVHPGRARLIWALRPNIKKLLDNNAK